MTTLAVSSFSLHSVLGPIALERRDEDGIIHPVTYDFPCEHTLEEFISLVPERLGVSAVELCQIQFGPHDREHVAGLRETLQGAGVRLLTMPLDLGNFGQANPEWRHDDEARSIEWFRTASALGARYVRVNAGAPGSTLASEIRPALVESLRRLGDAAGELGLSLLVENHGGTSSDPDFLLDLLQDVGLDRLGLLLDLGNFEPLVGLSHARFANPDIDDSGLDFEPLYDCVARLAPYATVVHAKAVDPARDGQPLPDLPRALGIVSRAGFNGPVSVEWEGHLGDPWVETRRIVSLVREMFPALT